MIFADAHAVDLWVVGPEARERNDRSGRVEGSRAGCDGQGEEGGLGLSLILSLALSRSRSLALLFGSLSSFVSMDPAHVIDTPRLPLWT